VRRRKTAKHSHRGKLGEALKWLERAYAYRDRDLHFIKGDPHFRKMEQNSRFKAFLRKMNLPDEWASVVRLGDCDPASAIGNRPLRINYGSPCRQSSGRALT